MTVCNHKSIPTAHFIPNSLSTFLHNPLTATAAAVRLLFSRGATGCSVCACLSSGAQNDAGGCESRMIHTPTLVEGFHPPLMYFALSGLENGAGWVFRATHPHPHPHSHSHPHSQSHPHLSRGFTPR